MKRSSALTPSNIDWRRGGHLASGLLFVYYLYMRKSIEVVPKKRRGRPATGRDPVTAIRLSPEFRAAIDAWAARQEDKPSRSEAIRRLAERQLASDSAFTPTGVESKNPARSKKLS
jgi:hypothetical protein